MRLDSWEERNSLDFESDCDCSVRDKSKDFRDWFSERRAEEARSKLRIGIGWGGIEDVNRLDVFVEGIGGRVDSRFGDIKSVCAGYGLK